MVLYSACSPIRVGDLVDTLAAGFPHAERQTVDAMVAELFARGVLITTTLRPLLTAVDGLGHVMAGLGDWTHPQRRRPRR